MKKKYVVMDGNTAAAHVAYAFTEVAAIYPITPSSPMAEKVDEWSAKGRKNLFGSTVDVIQMQSEAGAAGTCHGSLQAGALTTTFTSSQGLMLMIPAMYAMGGQFLPSVMHIASRVVTSNHHSIFGDHTDFMTCRTTGYAMLMSSSPQEAMDLGAVAHLSAISGKYAFMHCFDGFRTSHEMQRIEALDYEDLRPLVDQKALQEFRSHSLNPEHPTNRGNNVNPDVYFQCKEGANVKAASIPDTVQHYMDEISKLTGRDYKLFNYYGAPDAEEVIVVMCSASEAVKETVDYLNKPGPQGGHGADPPVPSLLREALCRRHPRHGQEDRRAGPVQGDRLRGRARVPGRGHRPEPGGPGRHPRGGRPVWPQLQGHHPGPVHRRV